MPALEYRIERTTSPTSDQRLAEILDDPGFARHFSDHMLTIDWTVADGWHDARIEPYGPIPMEPSSSVIHHAQQVFEGLKAYRHADGSIWAFRPRRNGERLVRSAQRITLPELPPDEFVRSLELLVGVDADWVPSDGDTTYYLRPFVFAHETRFNLRPAETARYMLIGAPAAPFFVGGVKPLSIWASTTYIRAAPGGTGAAKFAGNYGAGLAAFQEGVDHGCDHVCFLDAGEHRWIEELGGMNLCFVMSDGTLVTPPIAGTILEGVTRASILELACDVGLRPVERPIELDEWRNGVADGTVREVFACGTAAIINPVGRLVWDGGEVGDGTAGELTMQLRQRLVDIQFGRARDTRGWLHRLA
jgi:branched-chain amino acid aminotransferase